MSNAKGFIRIFSSSHTYDRVDMKEFLKESYMGCRSSRAVCPVVDNSSENAAPMIEMTNMVSALPQSSGYRCMINVIFEKLLSGVRSISSPPNLHPMLCLSLDSFPVIMHSIPDSHISLPVVAASYGQYGRIMTFAQMSILSTESLQYGSTINLLLNSFNWIAGGNCLGLPVLINTPNTDVLTSISKSLQVFGVSSIQYAQCSNIFQYKVVILTSDVDFSTESLVFQLREFGIRGGGIIVLYNHNSDTNLMYLNEFLSFYGICYSSTVLQKDSYDNHPITPITQYQEVKNFNLAALCMRYYSTLHQKHIYIPDLDDIISALRFYLESCGSSQIVQLQQIFTCSLEYLNDSKYIINKSICPEVPQQMISLVIQDIFEKVPLSQLPELDLDSIFPGKTTKSNDINVTKKFTIVDNSWISTGLYLPAYQNCVINCDKASPDVFIQIGSHNQNLSTKAGPWKRWPSIVFSYPLSNEKINVSTPFGGIMYLHSNLSENISFSLSFNHCTKYPVSNDWDLTQCIDVPFGEIFCDDIIFTLPSKKMKEHDNFEKLNIIYCEIINNIYKFLGYTPSHPVRVVFDVDIVEESLYPIYFRIDDIDNVLFPPIITQEFFDLFKKIGIFVLRGDLFELPVEDILGSLAAAQALVEYDSTFNPLTEKNVRFPHRFIDIWRIHDVNHDLIPIILQKYQNPDYNPENAMCSIWDSFLSELKTGSKQDITQGLSVLSKINQ